ncbi:ABC transporter permease [Cohnella massiliensis]|uniref:ABC transporter permease n=1 Tax=Cohnella massiliensis TaxID=1816691 RepID=UPI0015948EE1|nr:ABC transporter permease [Cohnella massiliensis]
MNKERRSREELPALRARRADEFRKEVVPYFRYVLQSGGLVFSAIAIFLISGYVGLLTDMPAGWPAAAVGVAGLAIVAVYTPLRTYLQPSDTIFLLPLETDLADTVIRPRLRRAIVAAGARLLVAFAAFAPLYVRAPETASAAEARPLWAVGLAFVLLGGCSSWLAWQERRIVAAALRRFLRLLRWLAVAVMTAALLLKPFWPAAAFAALCCLLLALVVRLPARYEVPWEALIAEEGATRRRWMRFLGWFVDVKTEQAKPAKRDWIAWTADLLPRRSRSAWTYLYAKTLVRGEAFGAFWRWNALMAALALFVQQPTIDLIIYAVGVAAGGLQLTELGRVRFAESAAAVPLSADKRRPAAAAVSRAAGTAAALLLWLAAALPARPFSAGAWLIALAAGLLWSGWLLPRRTARPDEDDDED